MKEELAPETIVGQRVSQLAEIIDRAVETGVFSQQRFPIAVHMPHSTYSMEVELVGFELTEYYIRQGDRHRIVVHTIIIEIEDGKFQRAVAPVRMVTGNLDMIHRGAFVWEFTDAELIIDSTGGHLQNAKVPHENLAGLIETFVSGFVDSMVIAAYREDNESFDTDPIPLFTVPVLRERVLAYIEELRKSEEKLRRFLELSDETS